MLVLPLAALALILAHTTANRQREAVVIPLYNRPHPALKPAKIKSPEFYRSLYWK